eukprot:TRINITY_DN1015_c1_g1_i1.p3 TRINITY_DN1015_c1_g1~~TRINITY_DN1015_c1_g1_i1.p3  ORF type:complete len:206 (-),score=20.77 TRINITY_DN1015_c1_g1_i1:825-1442(-)
MYVCWYGSQTIVDCKFCLSSLVQFDSVRTITMAMYCGCATTENRIKWWIFGIFVALGVVFTISWFSVYISTITDIVKCVPVDDDDYYNREQEKLREQQSQKCLNDAINKLPVIYGLLFAWILCYIICSIPLYMMCCCTNPPNKTENPLNATALTHVAYPRYAGGYNAPVVPKPVVDHPVNKSSAVKSEAGELKPLLEEPVSEEQG